MKKRIFSLLLVIAMLVTVLPVNAFAADDCPGGSHNLHVRDNNNGTHTVYCTYTYWGCTYEETSDCEWGNYQQYTNARHYQECSVCKARVYGDHTCETWKVIDNYGSNKHTGNCKDCGYAMSGSCSYSGQPYITENGQHWQKCSVCGIEGRKYACSSYSGAQPNPDGISHSITCGTCGKTSTAPCTFGSYLNNGASGHNQKCSECGNKTALSPHTNMTYTPYYDGVHTVKCADCGYIMGYDECRYGEYTQTATQHSRTCILCGDTVTKNHSFNDGKCECGVEKHDHNWEVSASNNIITVTCTGDTGTCEYNKNGGKLTVTAPNAVYDGKAKSATITNTIETGSYNDDRYSVSYYKKQANGSYSSIYSAPSDVGEYKVEVYSYLNSSKKASAIFEITAKPVTVTATGYTGTYDGEAHGITVSGLEGTGLSVQYATSQNGYYYSSAPTYTDAGTYTVYYKVSGSNIDNYEITGQTGSAVVKIDPVEVSVTATGYTGTYDGKAHGITVEVPEGMTVTYSEKENGYYYSSAPTYTDAGIYTVYYKVTGDKNHTVTNGTGSATVNISKADLKDVVKATGYEGVYDGKTHGITVEAPAGTTVSYSEDGQNWSAGYYANSFEDVCDKTVYYKVTVNESNKKNYTDAEVTGSATVKITPADLNDFLNVTASDKQSTYTGYSYDEQFKDNSIGLSVDYKNGVYSLPGNNSYRIEYKHGEEAWSTLNPKFTDADTYEVQYRIYVTDGYDINNGGYLVSDNFNTITGTKQVVIDPADLPIDEVVGYSGYYDGLNHYSLGYKKDNMTWIPSTPWATYMNENFEFTFVWTPEGESTPITTTATTAEGYEGRENWPHYKLQNTASLSGTGGASVTVTITDKEGNYKPQTFNYTVKIGPALAVAENYNEEYDAETHYISNYMTAYTADIEYKESTSDTWLPASQEPGRKNVGTTSVDWKASTDSDGDGKIGGYDAQANEDPNGIYNTFGSKEVITGTNTITVTPAPLTITANDNTITYGDAPADNGVTIAGFKGSDAEDTVLDKTGLSYTFSYKQFDDIGDYTITPAGIKLVEGNENYTITFADGKLTVNQKELGIVWGETTLPYTGAAQAPNATASGTVNGDEITLTVFGAQTNVGRYMATVTGMTGAKAGNYKLPANCDVDYEIAKTTVDAPVVTAKDETIRGKNDGGIEGLTTEMEISTDGGTTWTAVTDPDANLPAGTYQVRYAETATSGASAAAEVTINPGKYLNVTLPSGDGYTTSTEETADEQTYNDSFTFEVEIKDGYSQGDDFKVTANGEELTPNADGSYTITGFVENVEVKVEGVVDNTAPTGTITIATNQWKEFVNNITFGIFFKNTQTVTITAADAGSGVKSIEYIYGDAALTEAQVKAIADGEWAPYVAPFEIAPDAKVVVYAKITDKAGNVKFLSSDGMVFDGTAPVFNGAQDGGEYTEESKFTVSDDNLDKVTVDGKEIAPDENGVYTIPADNKQHTVVAADKSGNKTEIIVTVLEVYDVTLPKDDGYEGKGDPTVKHGDDYIFEVEIKDGYTKGDDFKVTVNGEEVKPNADGKYVVENAAGDLEIKVSGVEKIEEAKPTEPTKPTTNVPETGDEGIFLPLMLFMLSGIAGVSLVVFKKKFRF